MSIWCLSFSRILQGKYTSSFHFTFVYKLHKSKIVKSLTLNYLGSVPELHTQPKQKGWLTHEWQSIFIESERIKCNQFLLCFMYFVILLSPDSRGKIRNLAKILNSRTLIFAIDFNNYFADSFYIQLWKMDGAPIK